MKHLYNSGLIGKTKWFIIQDRLAKRYDERVDVLINDHQRAKKFGKNKGTLIIVSK